MKQTIAIITLALIPIMTLAEPHYSPQYKACLGKSGVTSEMRACNGNELKYQDKLLNKNYKQAMKVLDAKHKEELKDIVTMR